MPNTIKRLLAYKDQEQGSGLIPQDEIASFAQPVVILGDPGLGKSMLTQALGAQPGMKWVRAGTFKRTAKPDSLIVEGQRIIVDGLDEIASAAPGSAVDFVLEKLSAMGKPAFILSCREADWMGATDRTKIEDDYGAAPVLLSLQPFTRDDATVFLSRQFPEVDAEGVLEHLANRGIEALYGNPLTLRLLGEVAQAVGRLPDTRAQLFDRACRVMLKEQNPRHHDASHVQKSEEALLLAAGAVCASQLLCECLGVYMGPVLNTPDGFISVADAAALVHGKAANDSLKTRLFRAEGENRFEHIHRVVAEYLGAKWLARCFEDGVSEKRMFALFRQGEGVPTSLRGLHAWMAHFSAGLTSRCIGADPYAVLRYGDAETLTIRQSQDLLAALKSLSKRDPYFRSEDWGHHPASGLMRAELKDEILAVIESADQDAQLRILLLEAMAGTGLAGQLRLNLEAILFDQRRFADERSMAAKAFFSTGINQDYQAVIHRLLEMNDQGSARLAFEILRLAGLCAVSDATSILTLLAYFGLAPNRDPEEQSNELKYVPESLFSGLKAGRLASWLDDFAEIARPLVEEAGIDAEWYVTRLVRRLTAQALETDPTIRPERVWEWINWLDRHRGYNSGENKRLIRLLRENRELRSGLLQHVLLTPCAENAWMAGHRLFDTGLELYPEAEDVAGALYALRVKAGDSPIERDTWRDLLMLGRTADGIPALVRDAAVEIADGEPELLSILNEASASPAAEWKARRAVRDAEQEARRQAVHLAHRHILSDSTEQVAAGNVHVLAVPAGVYLGRGFVIGEHGHFDPEASPHERLLEFLGDGLADRVMSGFMAVLDRDDLPNASKIAEDHCRNDHCVDEVEAAMICGLAEMLRHGHAVDRVDPSVLGAVYMAWQRTPEANETGLADIGPALEAALFRSEADWELHFRTSIEPQLAHNTSHVSELYRLENEPQFSTLAGRLSVDWLCSHSALNARTQTTLLACALKNASEEEKRQLIIESRDRVHSDCASKLSWLSAEYVVDLIGCREVLKGVAADDGNLIWVIRNRIGPENGERFDRFSLDHLVFIVEAFSERWPNVGRPSGVMMGDCNPSDASQFIRHTIYAIASQPSPEATLALQRLISDHAASYVDILKHALALQRRARRDAEYAAPEMDELRGGHGKRSA